MRMSQSTASPTPLDWDITDRLNKALRVSGLSVQKLATDLGVHRNTIGNYLNGRTTADRRTLMAWALATGVPFGWLQNGENPTKGDPGGGEGGVRREGIEPPTRWSHRLPSRMLIQRAA